MNRREELLEQYEDAYFALLMDEVAEKEGMRLEKLNISLLNDPTAEVPAVVNRKCLKTIKKYFSLQDRKRRLNTGKRIFANISSIIFIIILVGTTALAASPELRTSTLNLLISAEKKYTELTMRENLSGQQSTPTSILHDQAEYFNNIEIGWFPRGFECTNYSFNHFAEFSNGNGLFISISIMNGTSTSQIDTENADDVSYITINGLISMRVIKDEEITTVLMDEKQGVFIYLWTSEGISCDINQKIAEGLKYIAE